MDNGKILALDVGAARIGLALASSIARLASPAGTLPYSDSVLDQLRDMCAREEVRRIVVGLPRGMSGQETEQTSSVQAFGAELAKALDLPISWQDESLTSVKAEEELKAKGKPYQKGDIDALAATYILEDYL